MLDDFISVIILNWNGKDVTPQCLESVFAQTYPHYEVILIDNGSTDGSLSFLQNKYREKVILIENQQNWGFAKAVNQGIKRARGKYIALLNNDATADPAWLYEMVQGMHSNPQTGMGACKIYLADRDRVLDNTGLVLSRDGQNRCRGRLQKDDGQYDQSLEVLAPSGCAAIYRKDMLEKIGGFDERFFAYGEDMELGLRARLLGYTCVYISKAIVHHKLSASMGVFSPTKIFYVERNRAWIILKCFPMKHLVASFGYTLARYYYLAKGLLEKKGPSHQYAKQHSAISLLLILIQCHFATFLALPYLLGQRGILMKAATHKDEFDDWLKTFSVSVKEAALNDVI